MATGIHYLCTKSRYLFTWNAVTDLLKVAKILRSTNKVEKCLLLQNGSILALLVLQDPQNTEQCSPFCLVVWNKYKMRLWCDRVLACAAAAAQLGSVLVQDVRFTLDQCGAAVVSEIEGVGRWLSTEDRTNCEVLGSVPRRARYIPGDSLAGSWF